jgi:hypothetical protein
MLPPVNKSPTQGNLSDKSSAKFHFIGFANAGDYPCIELAAIKLHKLAR